MNSIVYTVFCIYTSGLVKIQAIIKDYKINVDYKPSFTFFEVLLSLCLRKALIYLVGQDFVGRNFCRAKLFVGQNFFHRTKNSSLSPDKKFHPIKVKVSLVKIQMNLRG